MVLSLKKSILGGLSPETRELYLKRTLHFFEEIGFSDRDKLVKSLNKLKGRYVDDLLFALTFYQYSEKVIDKDDTILLPVLLICLIDGIEEEKDVLTDVKIFLRRLEIKDKLYLLNNFEVLQGKGKGRHYRRIYHDLIRKDKAYKYFPDTDYEQVDRNLKKIDRYIDKIAEHFCNIRHFVLHEAKPETSVAFIDKTYGLTEVFSVYRKRVYKKKGVYKNQRKYKKVFCHFLTKIEISELRKIIKRGVLKKILKQRFKELVVE